MNILSLFDGISILQIAVETLYDTYNYYASEINRFAIEVTQYNYPNTTQLGDIEKVTYKNGALHTENGIYELGKINLLVGGSPCQNLSKSNWTTRVGLKGNKSRLFYEYVRLLNEVKPEHFLLENVVMPQKDNDIITDLLGVQPVLINSSKLTAQNRNRLYWSNIAITQPEDQNISIKSTLEEVAEGWYEVEAPAKLEGEELPAVFSYSRKRSIGARKDHKAKTLLASSWRSGRTLSRNQRENAVIKKEGDKYYYRALTPTEMERLQGIPVNYTAILSRTRRVEVIGNAFTLPVIEHILRGLK